jgi:transposase
VGSTEVGCRAWGAHPRRYGGDLCAPSRNTAGWLRLLREIARANPRGQICVVADNLSSHTSAPIRRWLGKHPRIHQVFLPVGACRLNLAEGWWRIFRKAALAGQTFTDPDEIDQATRLATAQLNSRAQPRIWGRPPPPHRRLRRKFVYRL